MLDSVRRTGDNATYKLASVESITTVMFVAPFLKASYPSMYYPWFNSELQDLDKPVSTLFKHHLHLMQPTSKDGLYMSTDTGGLGLPRLSDQILLEK